MSNMREIRERIKSINDIMKITNAMYLISSSKLKKAKKDFDAGEYQWVAEITSVLVYADPENKDARYLCADALEQLGYQAESGTWRNAYLSGAKELREGAFTGEEYRTKQMRGSPGYDSVRSHRIGVLLTKFIKMIYHENTIQHCDAKQGNEAYACRYAEGESS